MANAQQILLSEIRQVVERLYPQAGDAALQLQPTRKEFEGNFTLVVFPLTRFSRLRPEETAAAVGDALVAQSPIVESYNIIKGFLNITLRADFWRTTFQEVMAAEGYGVDTPADGKRRVMVEFSSPNTNKPLHLGHIRNNLLGESVSRILKADGCQVTKVNLVNDRGVHICKSMVAWKNYANGATPQSTGQKGDHLVGDCYVRFNDVYVEQIRELMAKGQSEDDAKENASIMKETRAMLRGWEAQDPKVIELWKTMNGWVYDGFDVTYRRLGITFDRTYYESQTYKLGREVVLKNLEKGVLEREPDGSVWADLTDKGLDRKLLLRKDGTSVYMTQDIGTAIQRFQEYDITKHIYVVGNEQNYHFQVLALVLDRMGYPWASQIEHLSYGMVELPTGKMKSREGTVVDADDLLDLMRATAKETAAEAGKLDDLQDPEAVYDMVSLAALKYFILKVDPKKNMMFNPNESIDFNGNTGPFVQYAYARAKSIARKAAELGMEPEIGSYSLNDKEIRLAQMLDAFRGVVAEAAAQLSPALVANYVYDLAKEFNQYYHACPILREPCQATLRARLYLVLCVARVIKNAMGLLGIDVPERM